MNCLHNNFNVVEEFELYEYNHKAGGFHMIYVRPGIEWGTAEISTAWDSGKFMGIRDDWWEPTVVDMAYVLKYYNKVEIE